MELIAEIMNTVAFMIQLWHTIVPFKVVLLPMHNLYVVGELTTMNIRHHTRFTLKLVLILPLNSFCKLSM